MMKILNIDYDNIKWYCDICGEEVKFENMIDIKIQDYSSKEYVKAYLNLHNECFIKTAPQMLLEVAKNKKVLWY